ncbi:MAG: homoserine dehydrogenase [Firmicutes bacterium]|nr:homoserine dehydrogenase [Candidatus Colimorpha enterica]
MINVALFGFGTVGSGVAEILTENRDIIKSRTGLDINVKYILDLRDFPDHPLGDRVVHDIGTILADKDVSIVAEMMGGVHPAYDFTLASIKAGKSAVTSNKAVVAEYGPELLAEAEKQGVSYLFEASVGGCIPIVRPLSQQAELDEITEISGILNGTTNYILTKMKYEGKSFDEALSEAQALGYAERDPSADVDGFDTCRKICILSAVAFGNLPDYRNVKTVGIRNVTKADIENAGKNGKTIKLIGRASKDGDVISVSTEPVEIGNSEILSHIDDVYNAIEIKGKASGSLLFCGKGAGRLPTADAVVSDIIDIAKNSPKPLRWEKV